jgi:SAM-dependent methyltransferase
MPLDELTQQTVRDFGAQWTRWRDNEGYYASLALLKDILEPLLPVEKLRDRSVADIGSGSGRVVNMLLDAGAREVTAVEPSEAFTVLKQNTATRADRIRYLQMTGDRLPSEPKVDIVISLGVIHHIPAPSPVIRAAYAALKPGGDCLLWLYGREGNKAYLAIVEPLRRVTTHLPDWLLLGVAHVLHAGLRIYIALCRVLPLPMRAYVLGVLAKFSPRTRLLTIFDQLNPAYAKYYTEAEARSLLEAAGFRDVRTFHRHGYSWTVAGTKPAL